jgi:hypothetical protein
MTEPFKVEIDWNGVDARLEEVSAFGDDLRRLDKPLSDEWTATEEARWLDSEGEGTFKVSDSYARYKADKYGNLPVEQLPDRTLYKSLTERGVAGAVREASEGEILYGSSVLYAGVQDEKNPLIFPLTEERLQGVDAVVLREWASFARARGLEVL